jgi:hypothetical protein
MRESNSRPQFGKLLLYHLTNPACLASHFVSGRRDSVSTRPVQSSYFLKAKLFENILRLFSSLATLRLSRLALRVGAPGFEPGVTSSQKRHVSRYTTPRCVAIIAWRILNEKKLNELKCFWTFWRQISNDYIFLQSNGVNITAIPFSKTNNGQIKNKRVIKPIFFVH